MTADKDGRATSPIHVHVEDSTPVHVHVKKPKKPTMKSEVNQTNSVHESMKPTVSEFY